MPCRGVATGIGRSKRVKDNHKYGKQINFHAYLLIFFCSPHFAFPNLFWREHPPLQALISADIYSFLTPSFFYKNTCFAKIIATGLIGLIKLIKIEFIYYFRHFLSFLIFLIFTAFLSAALRSSRINTTQNQTKDTFYFFREVLYYSFE